MHPQKEMGEGRKCKNTDLPINIGENKRGKTCQVNLPIPQCKSYGTGTGTLFQKRKIRWRILLPTCSACGLTTGNLL